MPTTDDPSRRSDSDSDHDLYTIPNYSSWFSWDEIHHNETVALSEFFNNTSISKTPKTYKEYRDFIINKYREDPSRKLLFTDVRKCLIGDVGSVHKIFKFLERCGLVNFSASPPVDGDDRTVGVAESPRYEVVVEEGSPDGVRVVEYPSSTKPLAGPRSAAVDGEEGGERGGAGLVGLRLPPLTSYSDVFGDTGRRKGCWNCGEECISGYYESAKRGSVVCSKCFKDGCGESKLADDFNVTDVDIIGNHGRNMWTDEETLLLLEAVAKYGDDWNVVAQHVRTKSKFDCISRLLELPFGEHILGTINVKGDIKNMISHTGNVKPMQDALVVHQEEVKTADQHQEASSADNQEEIKTADQHQEDSSADNQEDKTVDQHQDDGNEVEQIEKCDTMGPPPKRRCVTSFADAGSSLMKQVALLSTVVGPQVAAAAAEAAVTTLCNENPWVREVFEAEGDSAMHEFGSPASNTESVRVPKVEDADTEEWHKQSDTVEATPEKRGGPSTLHIRAAIATTFGAAAAHSKLLADQEEREMEHLMAIIIEAQLKKIQSKIKHFEELELIMKKEYTQIQQLKKSIIADWIDVLKQAFTAGISRFRDHAPIRSSSSSLL